MTRISRARILSLMRIKDFAERLSSAMVLLRMRAVRAGAGRPLAQTHKRILSITLAWLTGTKGLHEFPSKSDRSETAPRPSGRAHLRSGVPTSAPLHGNPGLGMQPKL